MWSIVIVTQLIDGYRHGQSSVVQTNEMNSNEWQFENSQKANYDQEQPSYFGGALEWRNRSKILSPYNSVKRHEQRLEKRHKLTDPCGCPTKNHIQFLGDDVYPRIYPSRVCDPVEIERRPNCQYSGGTCKEVNHKIPVFKIRTESTEPEFEYVVSFVKF